jgi:uncharacterized oxidoreductase
MKLSNNTILITGGASGIGLGLTERFIQEQNKVIIFGRRADALDAVKEKFPTVITKVCDIADETERIDLYNWVATNHSDVNVLVNNAGIQQWMHIEDESFYTKATAEITTNVIAPIHLTSLFTQLPSFNTVINVTSGLAFVQLAKAPVYCATKAFFHSFTMSLRYMLQSKNIEVIELIPPALNTDLGGKGLHDGQPPVSEFIEAIFNQLKEGKNTATFGFSEVVSKANPVALEEIFKKMNP